MEVKTNSRDAYPKITQQISDATVARCPIASIIYGELRVAVSQTPWPGTKIRNNALMPLREVFDMAAEDELIDRNPTAELKNLKHQKSPPEPFTREESELIIKTLYELYADTEVIHTAYFLIRLFQAE